MLAVAHSFTIDGPDASHVSVELDVRPGLPAFTIVGLGETAVRAARERIRTAIRNSGYELPPRRVTVNLAPAALRKSAPGLDLAIACALLAATEQLDGERLAGAALLGELALDGSVRPAGGALGAARATRRHQLDLMLLAREDAREAALVADVTVAPVASLRAAARVLAGGAPERLPAPAPSARRAEQPDLEEVRGRSHAVRTLIVAAAGAHNLLLTGAPGTGKTMLARRLPSIMPPLSTEEAVDVALLRGAQPDTSLSRERPFRAPHHTTTARGLIGGASLTAPGEVVLADRGVLFLDELSEFSRAALDALRQPVEDGCVTVARAGRTVVRHTRFMLVAASNPCPCGFAGEPGRCRCSAGELARHERRVSGPLLDRIDLRVALHPDSTVLDQAPYTTSARALGQVIGARQRQAHRLAREPSGLNSQMDRAAIARHVRLDARGARMLDGARRQGMLSTRGELRVLRVARTIADLDARERVTHSDLATALALRCDTGLHA